MELRSITLYILLEEKNYTKLLHLFVLVALITPPPLFPGQSKPKPNNFLGLRPPLPAKAIILQNGMQRIRVNYSVMFDKVYIILFINKIMGK